MEIKDVKVIPLCAPLEEPLRWSIGSTSEKSVVLVKIETDDDVVGFGETYLKPQIIRPMIDIYYRPVLLGRDPLDIEVLWELMFAKTQEALGRRGDAVKAISAIDIALHDIVGKALGEPLYRILGGSQRAKLKAYATGLYFRRKDDLVKEAEEYVERGFESMKMKIGYAEGPKRDLESVRAVRKAVGEDVQLMVDANGFYDASTAKMIGRKMEDYDVYWFEEPVPPEDVEGYLEVKRALRLKVAGGEQEFTRYGFKDLLSRRAVDVVQPDLAVAGGLTECRKIAAMASAHNISYAPHFWGSAVLMAASIHLCASIKNFLIFEYDQTPNPLRERLLVDPIKFVDGCLELPTEPGLGVEIDDEVMKRFMVKF